MSVKPRGDTYKRRQPAGSSGRFECRRAVTHVAGLAIIRGEPNAREALWRSSPPRCFFLNPCGRFLHAIRYFAVANTDFDIEMLAAYLHLSPTQVERLVARGKIPGRKVGGVWRFSEAEIHHWMEERIGLANEEELITVEGALHRNAASAGATSPEFRDWLSPQTIRVPLAARTRGAVIDAMVAIAAETGLLWDAEKMAEAVRAREELHSTALDIGVALLHPRRPQASILAEPILALGITAGGIP